MTFDEAVAKHQGEWSDDGKFRILGSDGYIWVAAIRDAEGAVTVTKDGARYGLVLAKEQQVVVESAGRKPRKKDVVKVEVPAEPEVVVPPKSIDDLEF